MVGLFAESSARRTMMRSSLKTWTCCRSVQRRVVVLFLVFGMTDKQIADSACRYDPARMEFDGSFLGEPMHDQQLVERVFQRSNDIARVLERPGIHLKSRPTRKCDPRADACTGPYPPARMKSKMNSSSSSYNFQRDPESKVGLPRLRTRLSIHSMLSSMSETKDFSEKVQARMRALCREGCTQQPQPKYHRFRNSSGTAIQHDYTALRWAAPPCSMFAC